MTAMLQVEQFRGEEPDGSHGDVHLRAHIRKTRRGSLVMCGRTVEGMRHQSTPFMGAGSVMCPGCTQLLVTINDAMEGDVSVPWKRILAFGRVA